MHQALEAKENVRIEGETQTLATITIQNYFRLYEKLAGMTGTAETEAPEFMKIYKLDVVVIPTNEPVRRVNYPDVIYQTKREKYKAIIDEIKRLHEMGRPVLVGTVSVEVSELLSRMLPKTIKHAILNAKRHQEEAEIVAKAGFAKSVTIATNMAGRGTDIKLGPGVVHCAVNTAALTVRLKKRRGVKPVLILKKRAQKKKDVVRISPVVCILSQQKDMNHAELTDNYADVVPVRVIQGLPVFTFHWRTISSGYLEPNGLPPLWNACKWKKGNG